MTTFQRIFTSVDTVAFRIEIGKQIVQAESLLTQAVRRQAITRSPAGARQVAACELMIQSLARIGRDNQKGLNEIAVRTASNATAQIKRHLAQTQVRESTGKSPHLSSLIASRPLKRDTGWVGVARESTLDRAINPYTPGYGPYWRAQEYGTGSKEVPSQLRRTIVGFFYASGASGSGSRPQRQYRGGGGPHPVFIPGSVRAGPRGGVGGKGTISKEIDGRHFIRDGADAARNKWALEMRANDHATAAQIARLTGVATARSGRSRTRRR